jgi:hypothetical protein
VTWLHLLLDGKTLAKERLCFCESTLTPPHITKVVQSDGQAGLCLKTDSSMLDVGHEAGLSGYRSGQRRGIEAGQKQQADEQYTIRVYPVEDLALIHNLETGNWTADFDTLVETITDISMDSWDTLGGPGTVSTHPATLSLAILQDGSMHQQIAGRLESLRNGDALATLRAELESRRIAPGSFGDLPTFGGRPYFGDSPAKSADTERP